MFKHFLFIFVFLIVVTVGGFFWALHSPLFVEKILTNVLKKNLKEYTLDELSIGSQRFSYPGRLIFSNVVLRIHSQDDHYRLSIFELGWEGLNNFLISDAVLPIYAKEMSLESSQIQAKTGTINGVVYFYGWGLAHFEGGIYFQDLTAYKYQLNNLSSIFTGDVKHIEFRRLETDAYKGKISSRILLDWGKDVPYSIKAWFKNLDLSAMKDVDPAFYGQMDGIINASVSIQGTARNFDFLSLQAKVAKDGMVNASLLKFVMPYIPRTQESIQLSDMIKKGLKVPVEVAAFEIHSIDQHKLSGIAKFAIKQLNLDLNLPIDILYDGNFYSLIQWVKKFSK